MKTLRFIACGMWILLAVPALANTWQVSAGWTRADVGLDTDRSGIHLGVGRGIPLKSDVFDLRWNVEYVQKNGAQPTTFSDPEQGFITEDAKVTLHWIQPGLTVGAGLKHLSWRPRVHVGAALGLKAGESWSDFPGVPDTELAYKDTDFVGHVGVSAGLGPIDLDARYTFGLAPLLFEDTTARGGAKADDDLTGVQAPRIDAKLSTYQVGVVFHF